MNTLFVLGNGFDLNLGMKTTYNDFYNYYKSIISDNEKLNHLKNDISKNYKNWSDLELAIGNYTVNFNSIEEFDLVFDDLEEKLSKFVEIEESKFDYNRISKEKLFECLCIPENFLLPADKQSILNYRSNWNSHVWNTNIITFNYTRSLEKIIGKKHSDIEIGKQKNSNPIKLANIEHIHGFWDDRMILGVNDISQVKNEKLHSNQDIIESLVKTDCNSALKHTVDQSCIAKVMHANLICLFGSSLGDTDSFWWELIGKQLRKDKSRLIIFGVGLKIPPRLSRKTSRYERVIRKAFFDKTRLSEEEKERLSEKVLIGYNTDMFKLV